MPSMIAAPHRIPHKSKQLYKIALTGTGTAWTGGTTFTVSGVAGVVLVSHSVASGTSAQLILTTGTATGTLTVSDGTNTATISVVLVKALRWFAGLDRR